MLYIEKRRTCRAVQYTGENAAEIAELTGLPRLAERMSVGMYAVVDEDGSVHRVPASSFERDWEAPRQRAKPVDVVEPQPAVTAELVGTGTEGSPTTMQGDPGEAEGLPVDEQAEAPAKKKPARKPRKSPAKKADAS